MSRSFLTLSSHEHFLMLRFFTTAEENGNLMFYCNTPLRQSDHCGILEVILARQMAS